MQAKNVLTRARKRLEDASESQIRLATARQQLLIKRGKVRTASRKVQLKRVDAGDAEATFMSRLREFVNYHREELPSTLLDTYDKVERTRDDLGEIEENYLQAERDLTGAEWEFMDQENAFYQFDLHSILPGEDAEVSLFPPDQLPTVNQYPPPPPPPPFYLPGPEKGSTTSHVQTPPPPPPPFLDRFPEFSSAQHVLDQEYSTVVAEVDGLRKDFDHLREEKAQCIDWEDSPDIEFADDVDIPDADLTASTVEYFDILHKISYGEAKAQQLKIGEMSQRLPASTLSRRYSDPTHSFRHLPASSTPMRRTQTESAVSMLCNDPTTKEKIQEWSLAYLKDNTVQKRLYLNTLEHHGVLDSMGCDWKVRAERYWNQDSCGESKEGSEYYAASTTDTSHDAESCTEACITQRSTPSPSLRTLLEWEGNHPDHDGASLAASDIDSVRADEYANIPLPPSPSPMSENTDGSTTIVPIVLITSDSDDQLKERTVTEEPVSRQESVEQHEVPGLSQNSDSLLRKDSCHSMDDHEDKKRSAEDSVSSGRTPETLEQDGNLIETTANLKSYEQWSTVESVSTAEVFGKQHNVHIGEVTESTVRPRLCTLPGQSSPTSPRPPVLGVHTQSHDSALQETRSSRPISERSESSRSFSRRIRDLLFRSDHRRSKSVSFIIGHSSADDMPTSEGIEKEHVVSS
jgi:hypothetical protein